MINLALIILRIKGTDLVVMQRRSLETKNAPGQLGFFGGHVDDGEDPNVAIKREIKEETSISIDDINIQFLSSKEYKNHDDPTKPFVISLYEALINDDEFDVYEGQGRETYRLEELLKRNDLAITAKAILSV